jgi:endonuclease/exonuclease/phosphatase family metal-dependent hydrolase
MKNNIVILFFGFSLLFSSTYIYSQSVVPSDRVADRVIVRENPNTHGNIVGSLKIGESAVLIESIPYWFKVELSNNAVGYVSKAWTNISNSAADSSKKTDLIIGSWNIKWFGHYNEDKHDYNEMAKIIQKMDVIAIQELQSNRSISRVDSLLSYLAKNGFKYRAAISDNTGYNNNPDTAKGKYLERLCFLWDIDRVVIINPVRFIKTTPINDNTFRQVPIAADFKVSNGNGFDFRIVDVHTVYNKELNEVRRNEIQFLNDWIIQQTNDTSNHEKNIIVIGDFNANPDNQPHHFANITSGTTNYRVLFEEPAAAGEGTKRTTIIHSANPAPEDNLLPAYDQALISNECSYALPHNPMLRAAGDLGVVEFDRESKWIELNNWNEVEREMSDHRPIWFRLDYKAEDKD